MENDLQIQIFTYENHPTLPSRLIDSNFCASTANSIGDFIQHFAGIPVDDQTDSVFGRQSALVTVEQLVFADLRRRRLVLHDRAAVVHLYVRERMRPATVADQQRIALRKVTRAFGLRRDPDQSPIAILTAAGRDPLLTIRLRVFRPR